MAKAATSFPTASIAGLIPGSGPAYDVTKYGVVALSEGLRVALASRGIGVSVLCPGFIRTQIMNSRRNVPQRLGAIEEPPTEGPPAEFVKMVEERVSKGDRKAVEASFAATLAEFGRIDACFANAGIGGGGRKSFVDRSEDEWRRMFAVNLDSVFHLFQFAARHMMDRAASGDALGRLVATSSTASIFGTARNEHYAATKAAMNALVRALAVGLARYGITANAILPGWIRSEMTAEIMTNEKFVSNVMPRIPMRRFGEPEDFGGIAVYLTSKASSYHTAECFVVDGGYSAF
jgi:NAD(P)-dependent dehydrogenase (short-subunit alcohol dehydrogenase family)